MTSRIAKADRTIEVLALDADGHHLSRTDHWATLTEAKRHAARLVKEAELIEAGMVKVEVRKAGVCMKDWFVKEPVAKTRAKNLLIRAKAALETLPTTEHHREAVRRVQDALGLLASG